MFSHIFSPSILPSHQQFQFIPFSTILFIETISLHHFVTFLSMNSAILACKKASAAAWRDRIISTKLSISSATNNRPFSSQTEWNTQFFLSSFFSFIISFISISSRMRNVRRNVLSEETAWGKREKNVQNERNLWPLKTLIQALHHQIWRYSSDLHFHSIPWKQSFRLIQHKSSIYFNPFT